MDKKTLRSQIRAILNNLSDSQYKERSAAIAHTLLQQTYIIDGKTIAITMSNRPEVDTKLIIEKLWQLGKQVVVPRCIPATRAMQFYEITSFDQLERIYMDILEPIPSKTTAVEPEQIDCILVPGIVFDRAGYRIGFGGGYYDRFLQTCDAFKISLAFHEQIVACVPKEAHDIPTQMIITDKEKIVCKDE